MGAIRSLGREKVRSASRNRWLTAMTALSGFGCSRLPRCSCVTPWRAEALGSCSPSPALALSVLPTASFKAPGQSDLSKASGPSSPSEDGGGGRNNSVELSLLGRDSLDFRTGQNMKRTPFDGRILMLGCGSVGQCALPLVRRHIDMPADRLAVMDFEDVRSKIDEALRAGVRFKRARLTRENYNTTLGELVGPGDLIIDLSWNVETYDMLAWCGEHDVRYLNTSLEEWNEYGDIENKSPY